MGYNNHFLNMNSFYAKFTYAQNTFYLIKEIRLNPKKFSLKSLLLGNRKLSNWGK